MSRYWCISFLLLASTGPLLPVHAESLSEAVRTTLTSNPAARAADANVKATALELLQLKEEYLPRINLFGEVGPEYYDDADLFPTEDPHTRLAREVGIAAELTLFDGYGRANRVYRNSSRLDGAIFRLLDASETLALSAVQAYVDVVRHGQLLRVADETVARHQEIKRQVDERVEGGRQPVSASFEVEERLMAARLARLEVRKALADAHARYRAVVGQAPGLLQPVPDVGGLPRSLEELNARAVGASYRVRFADTVIRERTYTTGAVKADQLPRVTLRGGARYGMDRYGNDGDESDVFVGVRVDWDFYTGGRKARSGALSQRVQEAVAERQEAVLEVQELAAQAWNAYQIGVEQAILLDVRRKSAENVVVQYREEFRAGTRTLLDLLDAERTLFNIRFEEVSARASIDFNEYRLLAVQSRLAAHFGVEPADMAFDPTFEQRALTTRPAAIFNTEIRALE